ncbi:hypothetical protein GR268_37675 [Rhizobium leguminosarum]|nr:hypothetical protein [Rhizobium leguminosarum]
MNRKSVHDEKRIFDAADALGAIVENGVGVCQGDGDHRRAGRARRRRTHSVAASIRVGVGKDELASFRALARSERETTCHAA